VNEALRGMWHEVALGETGSLVVQNIFENCLEEDKVSPCYFPNSRAGADTASSALVLRRSLQTLISSPTANSATGAFSIFANMALRQTEAAPSTMSSATPRNTV